MFKMKTALLFIVIFSLFSCKSGKAPKRKKRTEVSSLHHLPRNGVDPNEELSRNEKDLEAGSRSDDEVEIRSSADDLAIRRLALTRSDVGVSKRKFTPRVVKTRVKPNYVSISKGDLDSIKATCGKCARKRVSVSIVVNKEGKVRLEAGQLLDSKLVECLVTKLSKISFFKGKQKIGRITIP